MFHVYFWQYKSFNICNLSKLVLTASCNINKKDKSFNFTVKLHLWDFFLNPQLLLFRNLRISASTLFVCSSLDVRFLWALPVWHFSSTSNSTAISTSLPTSISLDVHLHLSLHHCSESGNCTEHARCRCSLQMEQSGEKEEEEKGMRMGRSSTGAAQGAGRLLQLWKQGLHRRRYEWQQKEREGGQQMAEMTDHPRGEEIW